MEHVLVKRFVSKVNRTLAERLVSNYAQLNLNYPVVSFTFDDCPRSSIIIGAKILQELSFHGTYYISGGLTNEIVDGIEYHKIEDIEYLVSQNHEIGSHLFNHVRCEDLKANILEREIDQSKTFINQCLGYQAELSFSYPFGSINTKSKRILSKNFVSCRGITPGINIRKVDLANLKGTSLYSSTIKMKEIYSLISENAQKNGWLIFYTHDVQENPTSFGINPNQFREILQFVHRSNSKVYTVGSVLSGLLSIL